MGQAVGVGRRGAAGVVVLLCLAAWSGACRDAEPTGPSAPAASTGSTRSPSPAAAAASDALALDQPSALDLLAGRGAHGTFTIAVESGAPAGPSHITVAGRYVVTSAGLTYTVVDLDLALVRAEVDRLLAMTERFDGLEPLFADAFLSTDTVVTDQLQLGLGDLVLASGALGSGGYLATVPWLAFTSVETGDIDTCERAVRDLAAAVRRRLVEDAAALGASWTPDAAHLGGDELDAVETSCDGLDPLEGGPAELAVGERTLRVEADGEAFLTVEVQPGAGEPLAVQEATPAPLLDGMGAFFVAIDRCGELPWMYSNFAAANSYTSPDEPTYIGPGPFGDAPVCEADVPEQ